jgi:oligosaccharyltransferase complex subunit epsilon
MPRGRSPSLAPDGWPKLQPVTHALSTTYYSLPGCPLIDQTSLSAMSTSSTSAPTQTQLQNSLSTLVHNYKTTTSTRIKLIDSFLLFFLLSGVLTFAYRVLITSYPYYAFAGGRVECSNLTQKLTCSFGAFVGQFCLLAGLRAQVAPGRDAEFKEVSEKRSAIVTSSPIPGADLQGICGLLRCFRGPTCVHLQLPGMNRPGTQGVTSGNSSAHNHV